MPRPPISTRFAAELGPPNMSAAFAGAPALNGPWPTKIGFGIMEFEAAPSLPVTQGIPGPIGARNGPSAGRVAPAPAIGPDFPTELLLDRGLTCAALGALVPAIASLRMLTQREPDSEAAWLTLGDLLALSGDHAAAQAARAAAARHGGAPSAQKPHENAPSLVAISQAERHIMAEIASKSGGRPRIFLRQHLFANPKDVAALRLMAAHVVEAFEPERAKRLLQRALQLAPNYFAALEDYAKLLMWAGDWAEALVQLDHLVAQVPANETYQIYRANTLVDLGETDAGIRIYEAVLARGTVRDSELYAAYANALREAGRRAECARAYRRCIELHPETGEAYWGLANLKFEDLNPSDIAAMRAQVARPDLPPWQRLHFHYALGHALEKQADYAGSFANYAEGARIRRENLRGGEQPYEADELSMLAERVRGFFTPARLAAQAARRPGSPVPIFIVGMPRSGSTLIEQILATHNSIEGLQELPELGNILMRLDTRNGTVARSAYPDCLAELDSVALAALGDEYLARCAAYRKTDRPYFIDKLPGNWLGVGLIRIILPDARIVDARRHPMAACMGTFKQLIISGATFTYDLTDIGRRYHDYAALMGYFDTVLPGFVHRVHYEDMVMDTEAQIRALLAYCGVEFDSQCLRFWETERAVRTPSSEQVRRPISRDSTDQWRQFEPWLDELKHALGPALTAYRPAA